MIRLSLLLPLLLSLAPLSASGQAQTTSDRNGDNKVNVELKAFLDDYLETIRDMHHRKALASWKAACSGDQEDFDRAAEASLESRKYHSDPKRYARLLELKQNGTKGWSREELRSLEKAELAFQSNQLPPELLKQMVELSTEIEKKLNTYRAKVDGKRYSNNELLEMLRKEADSSRRKELWKVLKQVGAEVAPLLIELAELRNRAARSLGYDNYWEMKIHLQEHDPEQLMNIFDDLDRLTRKPFVEVKQEMDAELAERFAIEPEDVRPWHYDNPFFQAAPPSPEADENLFYEEMTQEEITEISKEYFASMGLPVEEILAKSDLYEREGKDQHAFCTMIDHQGDVRILCNIKPTAKWMDTTLHELGHAVYSVNVNRFMPVNISHAAHPLTTEGVAMMFGALAKDPAWIIRWTGANPEQVDSMNEALLEQRRREQLVFARWVLVMLNFEKSFYENPHQNLNQLWWDLVEQYQMLTLPEGRDQPDWAAKPHFTIAPVYYHNYMLGELFAAQLRHLIERALAEKTNGGSEIVLLGGSSAAGQLLIERVFHPGALMPWPEFVEKATGEPLNPQYFAEEVRR